MNLSSKTVIVHAHVVTPATTDLLPISDMPLLDLPDQAIIIEDGQVQAVVPSSEAPVGNEWNVYDVRHSIVAPGFVEPHTHSVFAGDRSMEFHSRIQGEAYADQQKKGGINATVEATRAASDDELSMHLQYWLNVFLCQGTTSIEVKSGYGLCHEQEMRLLRVIHRAKQKYDAVATYLGAHAIPRGVRREDYIEEMITETMPAIKENNLASFVDVFISSVGYTVPEADAIFGKAFELGFQLKAHLWEMEHDDSRVLLEKYPFASIDHLEFAQEEDIQMAISKNTVPVLLPLTAWHLGYNIRDTYNLIKQVDGYYAISTDFNPGTSFAPSTWQAITVGHIAYGLPVHELFLAATVYAARALNRTDIGTITPRSRADIIVLGIPSLSWLGYLHGINPVEMVFVNGNNVIDRRNVE